MVVVSFNTRDALDRCLSSLEPTCARGALEEVVVVDNASTDGSADAVAQRFPNVTLIRNAENRGFGAANNQALDVVTADRILLLNSDAWAEGDAVERLSQALDDPTVAAAGGRLVYPDGRTQNSTAQRLTWGRLIAEQTGLDRLFPDWRGVGDYWTTARLLQHHHPGQVHDTPQLMGACLMLRPGFRFDERYPLYCEDTELCDRLRAAGRLVYVPDAVFGHALGGSTSADRWRGVALYNAGKERYFGDRHGSWGRLGAWCLNRFGALGRLFLWSLANLVTLGQRPGWRGQPRLFLRVLTAPWTGPPLRQPPSGSIGPET